MRTIHTDGSCLGNPGPGGWAYVTVDTEASGHESATTNNRMEMTAVIAALHDAPVEPIEIVSDSKYVVDCINQAWYVQWQRNGWKTSKKKPVLNADLWTELLACVHHRSTQGAAVTFRWTKGHAGQAQNERADLLARQAAEGVQKRAEGSTVPPPGQDAASGCTNAARPSTPPPSVALHAADSSKYTVSHAS